MIKEDLIRTLTGRNGLSKPQAISAVESLLEIMKDTLAAGEDVLISGFGKFSVKDKGERQGRNPATGGSMILDARRVIKFRCSPSLAHKINERE